MTYLLSPSAQSDIKDIFDFIHTDSPQNARKVVIRIYDLLDRIAENPGIGHHREELQDEKLRVASVFHYLAIYDPSVRPIHILRVVHGARDLHRIPPSE